ncbi:MAG: tetratricopeptide repeat protein [Pirellulales bacterium]
MKSGFHCLIVVMAAGWCQAAMWFPSGGSAWAEERPWAVRGAFESLVPSPLPDTPSMVVIRLEGDRRIEVPLDSLSETDREWVARQAGRPLVSDPPSGKPLATSSNADEIGHVEADAIACRTAADAVNVYRLALAAGDLSPPRREAAEERLAHWRRLADEGKVRLGQDWVSPDVVEASSRESNSLVDQAIELMRIGNTKLAREMFEKAGRVGRENLRSEFLLALMPLAQKPAEYDRTVGQLTELVRRFPGNGFLMNDLAVCEIMSRRPAPAHGHFGQALQSLPDGRVIADNVGLVVANANKPRSPILKMPERMEVEFADLYRFMLQDLKLKPLSNAKELVLLGLNGQPMPLSQVTAAGIATLAGGADAQRPARVETLGVLVAPCRILADRAVASADTVVTIRNPANAESQLPATVLATLDDPAVCLLACDGLKDVSGATPLPVAATLPAGGGAVVVVGCKPEPLLAVSPRPVQATIVAAAKGDADGTPFVYAATVPRGAGGGAIIDTQGRLVGITAATPRTDNSGNTHGLGIPVERLWSFLKQYVNGLEPAADDDAVLAADEVQAGALNATVTVVAKPGPPQTSPAK